jgi:TolB-like protein
MADAGTRFFYEFGEFRLDPQQRLLCIAADGRPVLLVPKAFETLMYLLERRGESLSKNLLMKALWPNLVVEENSLNQTISAVRRALGERPGEHRFIVTEPGRGYRFVADVRVTSAAPKDSALAAPAAAGPAAAAPKSIAVLPLANLTGDPGKEYFSDGMAEELIHTLARIPGLRVPSRTSSFAYKGRNIDVRQIARDLEVATVLEGSVRSAGDRVRVTVQLIDGSNGFHLWSQNYDRDFGDLFKLQDELAHAIVQALRVNLDAKAEDRPLREPPTRDLEAYHLFLQALTLQAKAPFAATLPQALQLLQRALERDPSFAEAHNAVAALRAVALVLDVPLPGSLAELESDILRRLEREPNLASIHVALGVVYAAHGRWVSAQQQFDQGLSTDGNDPSAPATYGANLLGTVGLVGRYLEMSLKAHRMAPGWVIGVVHLAVAYAVVGDDQAARRYAELLFHMGIAPALPPLNDLLTQLEVRAGRFDQAAELALAALTPESAADGGAETVRELFTVLRDRSPPQALLARLDRLRDRMPLQQFLGRRFIVWYVLLGALDQAFAILNESLDRFARSGTIGTTWSFLWMPELLPFRRDPRFQLICRRMGLFEYWDAYGPPDHCELKAGRLICQ